PDAAKREAAQRAEAAGEKALEHRSLGARVTKLRAEGENLPAAAVIPLANGPVFVSAEDDLRESVISGELLEAQAGHEPFGRPEDRVARIVSCSDPEADQGVVALVADNFGRGIENQAVDADILDAQAAVDAPVAVQPPANRDARAEPRFCVVIVVGELVV